MADYYKLTGVGEDLNRHTDWTAEIVLERDDNGEVTKAVSATKPAELTAEDRKKVEELGYTAEKVTKEEFEQAQNAPHLDPAVAGVVFGTSEAEGSNQEAAQAAAQADEGADSSKSKSTSTDKK